APQEALRKRLLVELAEPGHGAAAGSSADRGPEAREALEVLEALEAIESIEAELTGLIADFERTSRVRRAELGRLRADLESAVSAAAPGERGAGAADAAGAVRDLSRRLAP
ncbi:hypothetical protein, partial [Streptomyces sp. NPDC001657]|uniref:hypothetical protein n=1 Tax=Streptomyces sp. NPDC001657 TaxID=3154522 RepID=UPI003321C2E3